MKYIKRWFQDTSCIYFVCVCVCVYTSCTCEYSFDPRYVFTEKQHVFPDSIGIVSVTAHGWINTYVMWATYTPTRRPSSLPTLPHRYSLYRIARLRGSPSAAIEQHTPWFYDTTNAVRKFRMYYVRMVPLGWRNPVVCRRRAWKRRDSPNVVCTIVAAIHQRCIWSMYKKSSLWSTTSGTTWSLSPLAL